MFDTLTFEWFLPRAALGFIVGSLLRILEHYFWVKQEGKEQEDGNLFYRSLVIMIQVLIVGVPSAYLLILVVVSHVHSWVVIEVVGWIGPIFASFVALDIREMIRKVGPPPMKDGDNSQ